VIQGWRFVIIGRTRRESKGRFRDKKILRLDWLWRTSTSREHGLTAGLIMAHEGFATGWLRPVRDVENLIGNRWC
jgi:hypothetical protein